MWKWQAIIAVMSVVGMLMYAYNPRIKKGSKLPRRDTVHKFGLYILLLCCFVGLCYFLIHGQNYLAGSCGCFVAMCVYGIHYTY
jgi:hypothetical protein